MINRYSWKKMLNHYNASYFNIEDLKKDRDGIPYNKLILDEGLTNMEFIQWDICTSPNFYKYVPIELLNETFIREKI